jgi:hypothetical protein
VGKASRIGISAIDLRTIGVLKVSFGGSALEDIRDQANQPQRAIEQWQSHVQARN